MEGAGEADSSMVQSPPMFMPTPLSSLPTPPAKSLSALPAAVPLAPIPQPMPVTTVAPLHGAVNPNLTMRCPECFSYISQLGAGPWLHLQGSCDNSSWTSQLGNVHVPAFEYGIEGAALLKKSLKF